MIQRIFFSLTLISSGLLLTHSPVSAAPSSIIPALTPLLLYQYLAFSDGGNTECLDNGGNIAIEQLSDGRKVYVCEWEECHDYDDGEVCRMHRCDLSRYYEGTCDETVPLFPAYVADDSVSTYFHNKVSEILENIENTGYSHNKDKNFSLIPDYTELATPHSSYNLFLDCSGFVGYYMLQGLAGDLYSVATPSQYECQERPLAADFADQISKAPEVGVSHPAATTADLLTGNVCWGQVKHVQNIKPGDVIVYKHPENIGDKSRKCGDVPDARKVHHVSGNTGHILFAHKNPFESTHCKDNSLFSCHEHFADWVPGDWQYGVRVADSTTSPHMYDSRKVNTIDKNGISVDSSDYDGHKYHAWTAGVDGIVERCDDGEYHRHCILNGSSPVEAMKINTSHPDHATGVGAGVMYISPDRRSFRSSYTSTLTKSDEQIVFIGRAIVCE